MLSVLLFLGGCFVFGACIALIWAVLAKLLPAIIKSPFIFFKSARWGVQEGREKWQNANTAWDELHPEPPPTHSQGSASFKQKWNASCTEARERQANKPPVQPVPDAWRDLKATFREVLDTSRHEVAEIKQQNQATDNYHKEKRNFLKNYKNPSEINS